MAGECELYKDLLAQEALGETTEKERLFLRRHLDSCAACRGELAAMSDVISVMKREKQEAAPAGLAERTLHRVERAGERFTTAAAPYAETHLLSPATWRVRRGLVGWMVAASVLVMAVASLVPGVLGTGERAKIDSCQEHMRQLATALRQYAADHNEVFPQGPEWYRALDYDYLHRSGALLCPSRLAVGRGSERETDYVYNPARVSMNEPSDYPLLWDTRNAHELHGRNVLTVDGTVRWITEEEFQRTVLKYKVDELNALD